jgi:hypothetical protein
LQNVLLDYGLEGYGLYWYCIELIAGKVDKENITFELEHDARIIARNTGCTPQKVEEMMRYFVDIGLFENSQGVITCLKIAKRLDKSMTSNPEMRAIIEKLKNHDEVMTPSEKPMQDKIRLEENKDICTDKPVKEPCKRTVCPYEDIKNVYNSIVTSGNNPFKKINKLTDKRKRLTQKFYINMNKDLDTIAEYFKYFTANAKDWQKGLTERKWVAPYEYIINEDTVEKCREGEI